jgi:hypothetical protein
VARPSRVSLFHLLGMPTSKLHTRLATVDGALSELEDALGPLLAVPLPATAAGLEPLQRAKLHALVPYLTDGLLFSVWLILLGYGEPI